MRFTFQYTFRKECLIIDQDQLLTDFEKNFQRTGCYHMIFRDNNNLVLINDIYDFNYLNKLVDPWNLWKGVGKMNIAITPDESGKTNSVQFSISPRRALVLFALLNIVSGIILLYTYSRELLYFFILCNLVSIIGSFVRFLQHKYFFNRTIKIGDFYKYLVIESKGYDWELIFKKKTNSELTDIIQGKTHLPDIVIELAEKELKNRNGSH
jgi:hypothetical protein